MEYKDATRAPATSRQLGIYVHVPFCRYLCDYCDFATVTGEGAARGRHRERYLAALERESELRGRSSPEVTVDTVYFGGGTPSLLEPEELGRILDALRRSFAIAKGASVSLEANPDDVDRERAASWVSSGVTRVTVGAQSMSGRGLSVLGRPGSPGEALDAVTTLSEAGVKDLGVDVIFGWPGQNVEELEGELSALLGPDVRHLSLYALEITSRTRLVRRIESRELAPVDPDRQAELYEHAVRFVTDRGFRRYEISNFAHPGYSSRHNLKYWTDRPYLGLGMSAASYVAGERWINPRRLSEYARWVAEGAVASIESYDAARRAGEAIVFGLRKDEGVDLGEVVANHGEEAVGPRREILSSEEVRHLVRLSAGRAILTERGRMLADELFELLI